MRRLAQDASELRPRWRYDCENCSCLPVICEGPPSRGCSLYMSYGVRMGDPPYGRQREVDAAFMAAGYQPEFRSRALRRLTVLGPLTTPVRNIAEPWK